MADEHLATDDPMTGDDPPLIAVIGMAARFPGAADVDGFWANLAAGRDSMRQVDDDEFLAAGGDPADLADPDLVRTVSVLEGIDRFDAAFFGYSPTEAAVVDPQQRLLLETAYHAVEDAGYAGGFGDRQVGVYAGAGDSRYYPSHLHPQYAGRPGSVALVHAATSNSLGTLATRVSYELGLTGPSLSLQTACSTALVAVHQACQDLIDYRCDTALAGAVSVNPSALLGYRWVPGGPFSPDGYCRAFAADAAGTSSGDGVGVVVLKRLEDAIADGDRIRAVVRGSAVNNDGRRKVGFTAPSPAGQTEAVLAAQLAAGVTADTIGLVEAHGTATAMGDPVEVAALTEAFRHSTDERGYCALGSVKTNIGHLGAAAGIAGFVKAVLALEHRRIPPTLHFERPNPLIDFAATPFRVPTALEDWPSGRHPRRAAVSAFGVGGTNAHVVLEEAPAVPADSRAPEQARWRVLPLSARTPGALRGQADELARRLADDPGLRLADVAHTLTGHRPAMRLRSAVTVRTVREAVAALRAPLPEPVEVADGAPRPVAFLFPGGGTQYVGMGTGLYRAGGVYRDAVDDCARILRPGLGADLRTALFEQVDPASAEAFLALVVTQYALTAELAERGVRPDAMIGHSLGEYTAACLAGVFTPEEMLPLVHERIRLITACGGATVGVALGERQLRPFLTEGVSLAAVNGPAACTVAGPVAAVAELERRLADAGVTFRRLRMPAAAHSAVLDPVLGELAGHLRAAPLRPPRIRYVTNVTGDWVTDAQAGSAEHWVAHTRRTVRFADGVRTLWERGNPVLVEIGPGDTLLKLAGAALGEQAPVVGVTTMRHAKAESPDEQVLAAALGRLWSAGMAALPGPDPAEQVRPVPLPGYAFDRRRYWIDAPGARPAEAADGPAGTPAGRSPRPYLTTEQVPPRTPLEQAVTEAWEAVLGVEGIGVDDNFFDLGGDSMRGVLLVGRLREAGVLDVPAAALLSAPTVARLITAAGRGGGPDAFAPLLPLRAEGGQNPLFCVHPGAGVSWRYSGLLPHLGADQPVHGIQALGLDGRRPPAADAAAMTDAYVALLREHRPHGPYRLLGWSYGGFVAHAVACALQRQGEQVELLAMLDAPQPYGLPWTPEQIESQVAALLLRVAGLEPGDGPLPTVAGVLARLSGADGATSPVTGAEAERIAEVMRNNLRIAPDFAPGVFEGDALFFTASADRPAADGADDPSLTPGKAEAWRPYVTGTLHDRPVACSHYGMTEPGPMAEIGAVLAAALKS
ncbi:beta-ketoacyl synthase N-terminal-like domain-containing protein [Kitasatospora sp. CM 4170]|uniref:Type I polyketide synthase n=1 Tax=Kitasatospora aburaviensis TaxID=67265 RepID=A0ABW1F221_9ACTN|nr:beta-ketoacyl synthase N-terminal-like domain-containing protein [Kitasatospora sp. CM 4170]WNM49026.1 beta-ketoacyl synthase N-terminal-like domain-containing protein [Kitasatospora sp. CM 4170]